MKNKFLNAAGVALLACGQLCANIVNPGGSITTIPLNSALPLGMPVTSDPFSGSTGSLKNVGSWRKLTAPNAGGGIDTFLSSVYLDTVTGGLNFFSQVQNTYTGAVKPNNTIKNTFTLLDFTGFTTDVYQMTSTGSGNWFGAQGLQFSKTTTDTVKKVSRSADGSTVTITLNDGLPDRVNSSVFEIKTNARNFDNSGIGAFSWNGLVPAGANGVAIISPFDLSSLEPIATPEPTLFGWLSLGFMTMFFAFNRRSAKR